MTTTSADDVGVAENEQLAQRLAERDWRLLRSGHLVSAEDGGMFGVSSPYSEESIAEVPDATRTDVAETVEAAHAAASSWGRESAVRRSELVLQLADAIEERRHDFAVLDSYDGGAPIGIMQKDVAAALESLRYFAGLARELKGYTVPASTNLHFTELQPFGVVAKIIAFNHPFMFAASKIAAPLIAGNTVVLKPSETTPLSALLLGEIANELLPAGVLNVVVGNGPAVPDALVRHPKVRRIGFTGSEAVGRAIQRSAAEVAVKNITLELGGKNALIAFPDSDPADVARAAVAGMNFTWSGQSCGSTSRLLLHEAIADEVLNEVTKLLDGRHYVNPLDPKAIQGTMVSRRQYERVLTYIDGAVDQGAQVVTGGGRPASTDRGLFIEPTFLEVGSDWPVANEEIFGPVVSVIRWSDPDEAVRIANSVDYGLTGSVFTNDIKVAHQTARALETGFVWINDAGPHYLGLPYGGWKSSGVGREESLDELLSYAQSKSVSVTL